jgi:PIN like domain
MAARRNKSKKQSAGSGPSPWLPEEFVLYLDENLCNAKAILSVLSRLGVKHERHLSHFPRGTPDEAWLPKVGQEKWALLTADKRIRYNFLEMKALAEHHVMEFVFASGNLSGDEMGEALERALPKMIRLARRQSPPFVAAITRAGEVHLRWAKK